MAFQSGEKKKSPYFHLEMSTSGGYETPRGLFITERLNLIALHK